MNRVRDRDREQERNNEGGEEMEIEKENEDENEGFNLFKQYLKQNGAKTILSMARQFKIMDENGSKNIDYNEFSKAMSVAGLNIPEEVLQDLFNDFDYNNSGFINYEDFMNKIIGDLNPRRQAVVTSAFRKLDFESSGVVELNEVKSNYNTKNNPQVLNGDITEEELYTHFIETFSNHHNLYSGIRDKRVTYKEFVDYYRYMSFCVPTDQLFEAILISAWRLENVPEYVQSQKNEEKMKQLRFEQTIEEKQESFRGRKNETSVQDGGAPFGVDKEPTDYSTSNMNYNENPYPRLRSGKRPNPQNEVNEIKANLTENPNNSNKNYNNNYKYNPNLKNDYTPNRQNNQNPRVNQNLNLNQVPRGGGQRNVQKEMGEEALDILREKIKERGARGIMGIRRCFMIYDESNSKGLTFENFFKYITGFLIPLQKHQALALFNLFNRQNNEEIAYEELIDTLVGKMNDNRKNLVSRAFNKIDINRRGVMNMNVIKSSFLAREHPDVFNGNKTEPEILVEFLDNFDYHFSLLNQDRNPDDEEVTLQEFVDFYRYISMTIDDDSYFEQIIKGVWGLNNNSNKYKKSYY